MIIRCSECGVQYRVDEGRLSDQTRIFRCRQCGEILRQVTSPDNSPKADPQYLLITCPDCKTKYRLNAQRLKEGKSGLRCRNCNRVIALRRDPPHRPLQIQVIRTDQPESEPSEDRQPVFQTYSEATAARKKIRVLLAGAAVGLLTVAAAGIFFGYPLLFPARSPEHGIQATPERSAPSAGDAQRQPFVLLEADLPALGRELQKRHPIFTEDPRWRFALAVLETTALRRAKLFLYTDPKSRIVPVLVLQGSAAADLKKTMVHTSPWDRIFLPAEGSAFRFSPMVIETAAASGFPAESYRIWFHTGWIACAPINQSLLWEGGKERWQSYSVARFSETVVKPIELAGLAVRIPEDLPQGWTRSLIPKSAGRSEPEARQAIDAAGPFLALLDSSMQQIDSMAGVFRFVGEKGRLLQYIQQFRQDIDGSRIFDRLQTEKKAPDRTSISAIFSELLHHDRLNTTVELYERQLTVKLHWQAEDDQALLQAVMEAVFGPHRSNRTSRP